MTWKEGYPYSPTLVIPVKVNARGNVVLLQMLLYAEGDVIFLLVSKGQHVVVHCRLKQLEDARFEASV